MRSGVIPDIKSEKVGFGILGVSVIGLILVSFLESSTSGVTSTLSSGASVGVSIGFNL
jgi:hypothetical protein